jgi:hypothetical protein
LMVAFTSPKTWSFGEILTSTDMNTYVRDNTADLNGRMPVGIGANTAQVIKYDTFTTTSGSYVDITGLTVSITPTSATSLVLVLFTVTLGSTSDNFEWTSLRMRRNTTDIYIATSGTNPASGQHAGPNRGVTSSSGMLLDNPGTTSAVTYSAQVKTTIVGGGPPSATINRPGISDANLAPSNITVIEVKA